MTGAITPLERQAIAMAHAGVRRPVRLSVGPFHTELRCYASIAEEGDAAAIVITENPDHPSTSVTNAIEKIAETVYGRFLGHLSPNRLTWIEHMPARGAWPASFDRVTFAHCEPAFGPAQFHGPKWVRLPSDLLRVA